MSFCSLWSAHKPHTGAHVQTGKSKRRAKPPKTWQTTHSIGLDPSHKKKASQEKEAFPGKYFPFHRVGTSPPPASAPTTVPHHLFCGNPDDTNLRHLCI